MHLGPHACSFADVLNNQHSCVSACDHGWPRKKRSPRCRLAAGMRRHATRLVSSSCCAPSLLPPSFPLEFAVIRMSVISPFNGDGTKKERRKGSHSYGARSALLLARSLHLTLGPQNRLYMRYAFETAAVASRTRIHETIITTCGSPALVQPPLRSADLAPSTPFPVSPSLRYIFPTFPDSNSRAHKYTFHPSHQRPNFSLPRCNCRFILRSPSLSSAN